MYYNTQYLKTITNGLYTNRHITKHTTRWLFLLGLSLLGVTALVAHDKFQGDPEFRTDVKDYYQDCLERGTKWTQCAAMTQLMKSLHNISETADSACDAAGKAALASCAAHMEESRLDLGDKYYLSSQIAKDLPVCASIREDAYNQCHNFRR